MLLRLSRTITILWASMWERSEEHTSELQSWLHLVCRLLLEKKKHEVGGHWRGQLPRAGNAVPKEQRRAHQRPRPRRGTLALDRMTIGGRLESLDDFRSLRCG